MAKDADSTHHQVPTSRVPDNKDEDKNNTVKVPNDWHQCFHRIFRNLRPCEQHVLLDLINTAEGSLDGSDLYHLINDIKNGKYDHLKMNYPTLKPKPKEEQ